ncbi:MAG: Rpn family recombination-promoting nuclease/putative transposase [Zetaproteobacteria bacterium]|nr:Rpn family recombination-promoting nuclease/putative transposase [Zetaproteobacteria bacterium]
MGEREGDTIWRVRYGDEWIYILIEFQSTVDRFMAVRLMTYIGLLYQNLIRTKQLPKSGKLPPVFPLLLYNGKQPWNSATALQDLTHYRFIHTEHLKKGHDDLL